MPTRRPIRLYGGIGLELVMIAVGLSMDAFAVALCKGLCMKKLRYGHAAVIALFFGGFQMAMPLIGWLLGTQFAHYIMPLDHWVAFALLTFIGGKMIWEAVRRKPEDVCEIDERLHLRELFVLAIATSIDALAVGITFAFLQSDILLSASVIGAITFALSFGGVVIGHRFGIKLQSKAEIGGGIVLILIGVKILVDHLGLLG
jgi:putative Mn2+ efflux pump MntP